MALNRNQVVNLITSIGNRQGLSPAQIRAMIATASVEAGPRMDPTAVGDGGTSFGLFQHHIGGAGGRTRASASAYLDPVRSITERAKWFKQMNITDGGGAARLQRPARPGEYAAKVNAALRGGVPQINAPVETSGGGVSEPAPTVSASPTVGANPAAAALYERVFANNPTMLSLFRAKQAKDAAAAAAAIPDAPEPTAEPAPTPTGSNTTTAPTGGGPLPSIDKVPRKPGEPGWRYLQRLGNTLFGLQNDPGNRQTTGGKHTTNSWHYKNTAIDFGDARNSRDRLNAWLRFANANKRQLGIVEALDEGSHIHVAIKR